MCTEALSEFLTLPGMERNPRGLGAAGLQPVPEELAPAHSPVASSAGRHPTP